jgi:hypothetical protein
VENKNTAAYVRYLRNDAAGLDRVADEKEVTVKKNP